MQLLQDLHANVRVLFLLRFFLTTSFAILYACFCETSFGSDNELRLRKESAMLANLPVDGQFIAIGGHLSSPIDGQCPSLVSTI
ncbi:TPA: hypothetical protein DEB00_03345 [Candidatus Uhrbacteria bacterium]|nr:hypothetical protein [Candidatus Uhrbacteria bacterium]